MPAFADIASLSIVQLTPGRSSAAYFDRGGSYEGNPWLKPQPPRFRASVEFEWEGDPPAEILALIARKESEGMRLDLGGATIGLVEQGDGSIRITP